MLNCDTIVKQSDVCQQIKMENQHTDARTRKIP